VCVCVCVITNQPVEVRQRRGEKVKLFVTMNACRDINGIAALIT
jgi:hypothetical protein